MQSLFNSDIQINKLRESFLITQFQKNHPQSNIQHGSQVNEYQGIDFIIDQKTFDMKWTNIFRPTYAVEISYLNKKDELKLGWFLDAKHITQFGLFVEADPRREYINAFSFELQELRNHIFNQILPHEILQKQDSMTQNHQIKSAFDETDLYLFHSKQLKESPFNLVIPKHHYFELKSFLDVSTDFGTYQNYLNFCDNEKTLN